MEHYKMQEGVGVYFVTLAWYWSPDLIRKSTPFDVT